VRAGEGRAADPCVKGGSRRRAARPPSGAPAATPTRTARCVPQRPCRPATIWPDVLSLPSSPPLVPPRPGRRAAGAGRSGERLAAHDPSRVNQDPGTDPRARAGNGSAPVTHSAAFYEFLISAVEKAIFRQSRVSPDPVPRR
jgi:hypothetical protein